MDNNYQEQSRQYSVVAKAISYIRDNARSQPNLKDIAEAVHLSEHHLQKVFAAWAGITPKKFLQYLTSQAAIQALKDSESVIDAAFTAGLSGSGRLHDLLVTCEAMTPGEIKSKGFGLTIEIGIGLTPFGDAIIAWTPKGICYLEFIESNENQLKDQFILKWPKANLIENDIDAQHWLNTIFQKPLQPGKIHLLLSGTNFQIKVWQALMNVPAGHRLSYSKLAELSGSPKASRAIGTAMSSNTIAYLIPCHRVIKGNGDISQYRWGANKKIALQLWENSAIKT